MIVVVKLCDPGKVFLSFSVIDVKFPARSSVEVVLFVYVIYVYVSFVSIGLYTRIISVQLQWMMVTAIYHSSRLY